MFYVSIQFSETLIILMIFAVKDYGMSDEYGGDMSDLTIKIIGLTFSKTQ